MPPLNLKTPTSPTEVALTRVSQLLSSQFTRRPSPSNSSTTSLNMKGIDTSTLIVVVAVSCGLATLVFLSCCFGCWRPLLDRWRLRKRMGHNTRAEGIDRTLGNTDGTASDGSSRRNSSESDTTSQHDITINEIMARQVFRDREQKAYRGEIKLRRLARAQDIMRSSQGLTLPVHFRNLKGKIKALSRSLAGTELNHDSVTSERTGSTSRACSHRSQSELGVCDSPTVDTAESVDGPGAALASPSGVQENMEQQSTEGTTIFSTMALDTQPAHEARASTEHEDISEENLDKRQS